MNAIPTLRARHAESGFFLIEAMVAILIFALGVLGLVAMGGTAVSSQSDAQYRTDASSLADAIAGQIAVSINRTGATEQLKDQNKAASLPAFAHNPGGAPCAYAGAPTGPGPVLDLLNRAQQILPGAIANPAYQQIKIDPAGSYNRVEINLCWKSASDSAARRHTLVTYVN
jgi:type IV pilus assembly protein PilV